ncbi:MAG: protein kinase domain-containing protein, partial [Chloroflexota bacterium]
MSTIEFPTVDSPPTDSAADTSPEREQESSAGSNQETRRLNSAEDQATSERATPTTADDTPTAPSVDEADHDGSPDAAGAGAHVSEEESAGIRPEPIPLCPFCGTPSPEELPVCATCGQPGMPLTEGSLLRGRYRIGSPLALSNTGAVYQARDEKHKRDVALKELLAPPGSTAAGRAALVERFRRELKRLAGLKHPSLPEILDRFEAQGRLYVVMPLLPARSLQVELTERGHGWAEQEVRLWGVRLLELLEYLESRRPAAVHGEILPEHIVLKEDGTPCLLSYGLAPRLGLRPYVVLPGQVAEQPEPQPAKSRKERKRANETPNDSSAAAKALAPAPAPTSADDLYAVGATMHELLTARDVFAGADYGGVPFPPVRSLAPRISVGMAEAVGEAVAEDPRRRFLSAGAMRAHLLQQGSVPPPTSAAPAAASRSRFPLVLLLVTLILIAIGVAIFAHNNADTTSPDVAVEGEHEVNPVVLAVPVPTAAHTARFSDTFIHTNNFWPSSGANAYLRGNILWLANPGGTAPVEVTRAGYATGREGFALGATIRLSQGPIGAAYGVVAADRGTGSADNVSLLMRATGQWALLRYKAGVATPLVSWRGNAAIRTGHNTPNHILLTLSHGAYTVTINGRKVAGPIPAGGATKGRVGLVAWPDAVVACDELAVDAAPPGPAVEEDFLDNTRNWSSAPGGLPFFHGDM